jgi:Leucine-rich repeat (LRR) protein
MDNNVDDLRTPRVDMMLQDVDFRDAVLGDLDDAVSYSDKTVHVSHVSPKRVLTPPASPRDRTGAQALVDLQLFTAPLHALRSSFATNEAPLAQLPNVEEYKAQSAYTTGAKKKKPSSVKELFAEYGEAAFLAIMVLLVVTGSFLVGSVLVDQKNSVSNSSVDDIDLRGDIPTVVDEQRYSELVDFISGQGWTSHFALTDEGSPQMRAAVWLADFDRGILAVADTVALRERYALAVLHFATDGRDWARDIGFLSDAPVCEWAVDNVENKDGDRIRLGVDCDCRRPVEENCSDLDATSVKRLILPSMNLVGEIPHEIFLLYDLLELDLNSNKIRGELSQSILLLRSLRILSLQYNRILGNIPSWIGDLVELRELNLASNAIRGQIPNEISDLQHLIMLNLNDNQLAGNILPLQSLHNLEALFLGDNDFRGAFSEQYLDSWPVLKVLDLSDNSLGPLIPGNLFTHKQLRVVDFHGNGLSDHLPSMTADSNIQFLALQDNKLQGPIPDSINNLSQLYHLDLSNNQLTGPIPLALSELSELEYLFLAFNPFEEGIIPHYLGNLLNLRDLSLQKTRRSGHIPPILGNLQNLAMLDLGDNELTGNIPGALGSCENLHFLILYRNYLSGAVPTEFKNLGKLQKLVLHNNKITERADYMCSPPLPNLNDFVMECDKDPTSNFPYCPCCKCCVEDGVNCNTLVYFGSLDPAWDTDFTRDHYKFHENDLPFAIDSQN